MAAHTAKIKLEFAGDQINVQWEISSNVMELGDSMTITVEVGENSAHILSNPFFAQLTYRYTVLGIPIFETKTAWPNGDLEQVSFDPNFGDVNTIVATYVSPFSDFDRTISFIALGIVGGPIHVWHGDPELTLKAGIPPENNE